LVVGRHGSNHINQRPPDALAPNGEIGFGERVSVRVGDQRLEHLAPSSGVVVAIRRAWIIQALVEEADNDVQGAGDLKQLGSADPVRPTLIFLHLLKGQAQPFGQPFWLMQSDLRSARTRRPTCTSIGFGAPVVMRAFSNAAKLSPSIPLGGMSDNQLSRAGKQKANYKSSYRHFRSLIAGRSRCLALSRESRGETVSLQKSVGRAIRVHRERVGLTQAVLAEAVGLTEQYIGVIERGVRAPSFKTLDALARTLKTPVRDFFPHPLAPDHADEAISDVISLLGSLSADEQGRAFKVLQSMFSQG
jgi:transcriptional regulator with XRE-family HTH domain